MKNKFSKKYKNVLITKSAQGMAKLSLVALNGLNAVTNNAFKPFLFGKDRLRCSVPCARILNTASGLFVSSNSNHHSVGSTSCARALSRLCGGFAIKNRVGSTSCARALSLLGALLLIPVSLGLTTLLSSNTAIAQTNTINFQGRLLTDTGALVPDGNYHVEFKLYDSAAAGASAQGVCVGGGTDDCVWVETRTTGNLVSIQNGYYSVYLGDVTSLPDIDWSQELYLTMNIGGTAGAASWDGEMTPRFRLTSVPYAFTSRNVATNDTNAATTNSDNVTIQTGDALGATSDSGDITIDVGTATQNAGSISLGATNASALTIGNASATTTLQGPISLTGTGTALTVTNDVQVNGNTTLGSDTADSLTVEADATFNGSLTVSTGDVFTNAGATLFTALAIGDIAGGGDIGTAAATVDVATTFDVSQTTASQTLTLADPTVTTSGRIVYVNNTGSVDFVMYGETIETGSSSSFIWNGSTWTTAVSFASTGVETVGAIDGGVYSANGASISGTTIFLQSASATQVGLVTLAAQEFEGVKTFDDRSVFQAGLTVDAGQSILLTGGNTASRPGSPTAGELYYDTDTNTFLVYNGTKWVADQRDAIYVASTSTSSQADQDRADYLVDGTNDETEINTALTAAAGAKVVLLEGTYVAGATILIPNDTTLEGVGTGSVIELADLDATDNLIENSDTSTGTGVVIRNLTLDGRDDLNTAGTQRGIVFDNMGSDSANRDGGLIENVVVEDFRTDNIYLDTSDNSRIVSISSSGGTDGIDLSASTNNTITGGTFINNSGHGIRLSTSSDENTISNNSLNNNGDGIYLTQADFNTVSGNTTVDNSVGIDIANAANNTITGNVSSNNSSYGIDVAGALSVSNTFSSNTLVSNGASGIRLNTSTNSSVIGNTIASNTANGIYLVSSNENVISSNNIENNDEAANNNGIFIQSSDANSIIGNVITDTSCTSTCHAINVSDVGSDNNYLEANRFTGDGSNAAGINDSGTNTIYAGQATNTTTTNGVTDFTFRGSADSNTAFQVQNAAGTLVFDVDTTSDQIGVNRVTRIADADTFIDFGDDQITLEAGGVQFLDLQEVAGQDVLNVATGGDTDVNFDSGTLVVDAGTNAVSTSGNLTVGGTIELTTLGSTDNASFVCRNTSNILAGCNFTPLSSSLTDNVTDALDIQEGTNNYININTTDSSENISFGNTTTNPTYSFLGSGALTIAGATTVNNTLAVTGTLTDGAGPGVPLGLQTVNLTLGDDSGDDTIAGSLVNVTGIATGDDDDVLGYAALYSGTLSSGSSIAYASGSGWDVDFLVADTTGVFELGDGGTWVFQDDGSGNNLFNITDVGSVANVEVTGTLEVGTLGSTDNANFVCRNTSNILAGCNFTPLSSTLTDNIADALDIQEGTNNYININTTNSSEEIQFGNATTNPDFTFLGTGLTQFTGDVTIDNAADSNATFTIDSGSTGTYASSIDLQDQGSTIWSIRKNNTNDLNFQDTVNGINRIVFQDGGNSNLRTGSATADFSFQDGESDVLATIGDTGFTVNEATGTTTVFTVNSANSRVGIGVGATPGAAALDIGIATASDIGIQLSGAASQSGDYLSILNDSSQELLSVTSSGAIRQSIYETPQVVETLTNATTLNGLRRIFIAGNYAYVTAKDGDRLTIVDITDPLNLSIEGSVVDTTDLDDVRDVYVDGKYAYVTSQNYNGLTNQGAFTVIDVSDPNSPSVVASINDTDYDGARAIDVSGNYAYIVSRDSNTFSVIDISDPLNPVEVGSLTDGAGEDMTAPHDVVVSGNYAYVPSTTSDSLSVIDISDPTSPSEIGSVVDATNLDDAHTAFIRDKYVYIAANDGITIVDVSDPTTPVVTGGDSTATGDIAHGMFVSGNYAYGVTATVDSFFIADVTDPTTPSIVIDDTSFGSGLVDVWVDGNYAYVTDTGLDRIHVLDIGGAQFTSADIGNINTTTLNVESYATVQQLTVTDGLNVGAGGINTVGNLSAAGALNVQGTAALNGNITLGDSTTDRLTVNAQILGFQPLVFQGATDNAFTTTLQFADPTANRIANFPDASGTVILSSTLGDTAFIQNGNSFGATAVLGTNDAQSLQFEVGGNSALTIADGGASTFQNETNSVTAFQVRSSGGAAPAFNVDTDNERVGINTDAPATTLDVQGAVTFGGTLANNNNALYIDSVIQGNSAFQSGYLADIAFEPGAATGTALLFQNIGTLQNSSEDVNFTGGFLRLDTAASYTGTINTGKSLDIEAPTLTGSKIDNYFGIDIGDPATNTRATGFINNVGLRVQSITAADGGGGVNNRGIYLEVPNGTGANDNSGLYITGGVVGANNYSIRNLSLAQSYLAGTLEVDGLVQLDGGLTVEAGDTFTFNGDAFTDLTGTGLTVVGNALTVDNSSATGFFQQGGNSFGATAVLGTNDAQSLQFEVGGNSALTIADGGAITVENETDSTSAFVVRGNGDVTPIFNVDTTNDRIGIGTASPSQVLEVVGSTSPLFNRANAIDGNSSRAVVTLQRTYDGGAGADGIGGYLDFYIETETEGTVERSGTIEVIASDATAGTVNSDIFLRPVADGALVNDAFVVRSSGDVGIGDATPDGRLEIRQTDAADILNLYDNTVNVVSVLDGGATLFQNSTDSTSAFQVVTSAAGTNSTLLNIDTTNELITVKGTVFDAATVQAFTGSGNITQSNIDGFGTILISSDAAGYTATLQDPTDTTAGRLVYVTNAGSFDMTLAANSGGTLQEVTLKPNTSATMVWNGSDWTAAGASSSTDLQAAYNNTATSAGGAELILNAPGGAADGLTVRNNATTPITGGLLEIQTSIGSNLFGVNNNATEFASNGGAETEGASASTFPSNTWSAPPTGGTVTRFTTTGDNIATGQASVSVVTAGTDDGAANELDAALTPNLEYTVSFAVRGLTNFSTLEVVYSRDGTNTSTTACASTQTVTSGQWSRITCTFTAPSSGITTSNAIFIRQTDATARTFYIDNLSVNINASATYAADGSVDDSGSFATNWTDFDGGAGSTVVSEETAVIYDTSASAEAATTANANQGIRNNLAIDPATDTQYLVSFFARTDTTMTDSLAVGFLPTGGTSTPSGTAACTDYNTQSLTADIWTKVTCLFTTTGTAITDADLVIYQTDSTARSIFIDALSITLNTNNSNNVQVGGGNLGGPVTLFTLDRSAGNPIADNNEAYLGSMYYDTITGRIQCYEADGWGACGAAPDNVVNLNPEYAGAVLNGSGVGTMTADFCSNDTDLSVNSTFCGTGEAKNFYNWTSPQATEQTYSIYVTYQLPETFNGFSSDDTVQLAARVDSTTNASVTYEMFRSTGSDVTQCGTGETDVITGGGGSADTWYSYGINGNEATGCSLNASAAGDFIIFKINMKAQSNANAYVSTLSFVTTGR